jgi:hypothetical protein
LPPREGHYVRALVRHPPFRYVEADHEGARAYEAACRGPAGADGRHTTDCRRWAWCSPGTSNQGDRPDAPALGVASPRLDVDRQNDDDGQGKGPECHA